jgi:hypothetical protein
MTAWICDLTADHGSKPWNKEQLLSIFDFEFLSWK